MWSQQSIYRIPSLLRDLDPKAYEPHVVSIGPYHHGKEQLQAMEEHKHRALRRFLARCPNDHFNDILAEFRRDGFINKAMNCYAKPPERHWYGNYFLHLMVVDGCFVLELLLGDYVNSGTRPHQLHPEWCEDPIFGAFKKRHGVVSYVKLDMLLLENQIPLIVLEKLATIANLDVNINGMISLFYGRKTRNDHVNWSDSGLCLHVLDVYRKGRICLGDYDGWASPKSAIDLGYLGVRFRRNSGGDTGDGLIGIGKSGGDTGDGLIGNSGGDTGDGLIGIGNSGGDTGDGLIGIGSFKDIAFHSGKCILGGHFDPYLEPILQPPRQLSEWFSRTFPSPALELNGPRTNEWYIAACLWFLNFMLSAFMYFMTWWCFPLWVRDGEFSLPFLTIDETTGPILLNLMAFERLHLGQEVRDMAVVTHYAFLMSSLIRSRQDVEYLRKKSVLSCVPGRSDESVVKLFADVTRNVVLDSSRGMGPMTENQVIKGFSKRRPNRARATWLRHFGSDLKTWITVLLTAYGVTLVTLNSVMYIVKSSAHRSTLA